MNDEDLLRTAGLNKYEASAYHYLIKNGMMTAKELSQMASIPMGKIYEVLSSLEDFGFLEVQRGRPIMYKPIKPSVGFVKYFEKRKKEAEVQLETLKENITVINNAYPKLNDPIGKDRVFISTVIGKDEITKAYSESFKEAEEDIYVVNSVRMREKERWLYHETVAPLLDSLFAQLKRGLRVHCIDPNNELKEMFEEMVGSIKDPELREHVKNNIHLRIKECDKDYVLVDSTLSIIDVVDPIEDRMFAIMKIYDKNLNKRLRDHFFKIWE